MLREMLSNDLDALYVPGKSEMRWLALALPLVLAGCSSDWANALRPRDPGEYHPAGAELQGRYYRFHAHLPERSHRGAGRVYFGAGPGERWSMQIAMGPVPALHRPQTRRGGNTQRARIASWYFAMAGSTASSIMRVKHARTRPTSRSASPQRFCLARTLLSKR